MSDQPTTPKDLTAAVRVLRATAESWGAYRLFEGDDWAAKANAASLNRVADWIEAQGWQPIADMPPNKYAMAGRWNGGSITPSWHEIRANWFKWAGARSWSYEEPNRPSPFYDDAGNYAEPTHYYSIPAPPEAPDAQ